MVIDSENIRKYILHEPYDEHLLFSTLQDIARLVIHRHFSSHLYRFDDLESLGIEKAVVMLQRADTSVHKNLVNFLYTGMRNSIGNDIKRERRYSSQDQVDPFFTMERAADIRMSDLRESMLFHLREIVSRMRALGFDPRSRIQSCLEGSLRDPVVFEAVKVASFRALSKG